MKYIYIFKERGLYAQSETGPTEVDMALVARDELTVLQYIDLDSKFFELTVRGNWMPVEECYLEEGCAGQGTFHYLD